MQSWPPSYRAKREEDAVLCLASFCCLILLLCFWIELYHFLSASKYFGYNAIVAAISFSTYQEFFNTVTGINSNSYSTVLLKEIWVNWLTVNILMV